MAALETYIGKHNEIKEKLSRVIIPNDGNATNIYWAIGSTLQVSGTTVKNYLSGEIKDGYLAEAIYSEFKRLKMCK